VFLIRQFSSLERRLGVELELNPISTSSRATRALRGGRVVEGLRLLARVEDGERLATDWMAHTLPDWPTRPLVIHAIVELVRLEQSAALARSAGVPAEVTVNAAQCAEETATVVWRIAERMSAAAAQRVESARMSQAVDRQRETLDRLLEAIKELRDELVEATLSPGLDWGSLNGAEERLRDVAEAGKAAREWLDETAS
jgi:hypothetical protein